MSNISYYRVLALALATFACNLVIAGAEVRVIDAESGAPISSAQVQLSLANAPAAGGWEAETNHEGIARLDGIHAANPLVAVAIPVDDIR